MKIFTKLFVSIFYVGYIKFASGTWGSLAAILILYPFSSPVKFFSFHVESADMKSALGHTMKCCRYVLDYRLTIFIILNIIGIIIRFF